MSSLAKVVPALIPPAISTFPFGNRVADSPARPVDKDSPGLNVPEAGLYNSVVASAVQAELQALYPPAIRTSPFVRSVAVCAMRGVLVAAVLLKVAVVGLYNSTELVGQPG